MGAKLLKTDTDNFILQTLEPTIFEYKLSLKNCQAVENGYDLDELARKRFSPEYERSSMFSIFEIDCKREGFVEGAKAILEIISDKKFSEDDVISMIKKSREKTQYNFDGKSTEYKFSEDELIQSLQQTEWDVEIVMEKIQSRLYIEPHKEEEYKSKPIELQHPYTTNPDEIWEYKPKFDSEGCLILKRIQL